jgi:hypothetical protein
MDNVEKTAVASTVRRMLAGNLNVINDLPAHLRPAAQAAYTQRADEQRRDELARQRANPHHTGPPAGLH